mgnify:FL=1
MDETIYHNLSDNDKVHFNKLQNIYRGYMIQFMNRGFTYTESYIRTLENVILIHLPTMEIYNDENT